MGTHQPRIFISYRRSDTAAIVGHLYDRMTAHYNKETVFRDVDDIPLGTDFYDHVSRQLKDCDIVLTVIGPRWLSGEGVANRMAQKNDPVRLEVEAGFASGAVLIPVLVEGAVIPKEGELPDSIAKLVNLNAAQVESGKDFDHHLAALLAAMDGVLEARGKFVVRFPKWAMKAAAASLGAALAVLAALAGAVLLNKTVTPILAWLGAAAAGLGLGLAFALGAGEAVARQRIAWKPALKRPALCAAAGGALVFLLVLAGARICMPYIPMEDTPHLATKLRLEYARAVDNLERTGKPDFARAIELVDRIRRIDPQNGHAWYYSGEIKRVSNTVLFNATRCFKGWPGGKPADIGSYEEDFYRYLEIAATLPALAGSNPGSETCYGEGQGYCLQRTAWIYHLLAIDFYLNAMAEKGSERLASLNTAKKYAGEALKYRTPEGDVGFNQCIASTELLGRIDTALARVGR